MDHELRLIGGTGAGMSLARRSRGFIAVLEGTQSERNGKVSTAGDAEKEIGTLILN